MTKLSHWISSSRGFSGLVGMGVADEDDRLGRLSSIGRHVRALPRVRDLPDGLCSSSRSAGNARFSIATSPNATASQDGLRASPICDGRRGASLPSSPGAFAVEEQDRL